MRCKIITDASFCQKTNLCGVAFSITIGDGRLENSYLIAECNDPNTGELFAIQFALNELLDNIEAKNINFQTLEILTDSETAIKCLTEPEFVTNNKSAVELNYIAEDIIETLSFFKKNGSIKFVKVKAHVEEINSTEIELEHNQIDSLAKSALRSIRNPLLYPQKNKNKVCIVNLDSINIENNSIKINTFIKNIISNDYKIRIVNNKKLSQLLSSLPEVYSSKVKIIDLITNKKHTINTNSSYEFGVNRALMKAFFNDKDVNFNSFIRNVETDVVNAAESAATLFTGINDEQAPFSPPSLIVDLTNQTDTDKLNYWLKNYASHFYVDHFQSIEKAYRFVKINSCYFVPNY